MDSNFSRLKSIVVGILPTAIVLALIVSSCELFRFRCVTYHNPILEFTVTPARDTIKVGDTLTLKIECSSLLKDWKNDKFFNFKNDKLNPYFIIAKQTDTTQNFSWRDNYTFKFNYDIVRGNLSSSKISKFIECEISNDSLFFEVKIIPTDIGFFSLNIWQDLKGVQSNMLPILTIKDGEEDDCVHRLQSIMPNINNGNSTIDRALKKGYKALASWNPDTNKGTLWSVQNSSYYFDVVPR